ncbi:polyketide cyclase [Bacteroidia bacterium]|nr:polyketide cyclase [Bacteroidia bacterium]
MTEFTSEIKTIPHSQEAVYETLSNLENLAWVKDKIPMSQLPAKELEKIKDFTFDRDSCTIMVDTVGKVTIAIIEREPSKTIKFGVEGIPVKGNLWIQLAPAGTQMSKIKLTVKADLPFFLKGMVSKPLQNGLSRMVEVLAMLPYGDIISSPHQLSPF